MVDLSDKHPVVIKVVTKKDVSQSVNKQLKKGTLIPSEMNHPCILQVETLFDRPEAVYIVMELVLGGEYSTGQKQSTS